VTNADIGINVHIWLKIDTWMDENQFVRPKCKLFLYSMVILIECVVYRQELPIIAIKCFPAQSRSNFVRPGGLQFLTEPTLAIYLPENSVSAGVRQSWLKGCSSFWKNMRNGINEDMLAKKVDFPSKFNYFRPNVMDLYAMVVGNA
jgi:hypothetical protein